MLWYCVSLENWWDKWKLISVLIYKSLNADKRFKLMFVICYIFDIATKPEYSFVFQAIATFFSPEFVLKRTNKQGARQLFHLVQSAVFPYCAKLLFSLVCEFT